MRSSWRSWRWRRGSAISAAANGGAGAGSCAQERARVREEGATGDHTHPLPSASSAIIVRLFLIVPTGTPREVVNKLNTEVTRILSSAESRKLMSSAGVDVATSTPEEFGALMQAEMDRWGKVVRETGATVN